jgi:hypothetical protein
MRLPVLLPHPVSGPPATAGTVAPESDPRHGKGPSERADRNS